MKYCARGTQLTALVFLFLVPVILFVSPSTLSAQAPAPVDPHLKWWKDARFGMFIHWGPISQDGTEISWSRDPNPGGANPGGLPAATYDQLYKTFDPTKFSATDIVTLAKSAGMKYIVFTCKHHDGFCEFDSKFTDYKITSPQCPYGKDIVRQLADATHKAGLHWCVYYSQPDLHNSDYKVNQAAYDVYFHRQVNELLTNYGKVDLIWFDGLGYSADFWDAPTLFKEMKSVDPKLIVNNRCGLPGDYQTPEQTIGAYNDQQPWETCMTIGSQWSYNPDDTYKSSTQCIQTLARCVGGDGNLLLNIGPRPDGSIDPQQVDRLKAIAVWMKSNSEAVYGTRGGPYKPTPSVVCTRKGKIVYVHVLQWMGDTVVLPPLPKSIASSRLLGGGTVTVTQNNDSVSITVPTACQDPSDTVVALTLRGSAMDLATITTPRIAATLTSSDVYQKDPNYGADKAYDDNESSRWATDDGIKQAWLEADFSSPTLIKGVSIHEAFPGRVQKFELQYLAANSNDWTTIVTGTTLGAGYWAAFPAVNAQAFRLNILDATDGPTISEISFD